MRETSLAFSLLVCLGVAAPSACETIKQTALEEKLLTMVPSAGAVTDSDAGTCVFQSISCGQTINGSLDPGDCQLTGGSVADFFQFNGTPGVTVTGTLSSSAFPPFLDLLDPTPTSAAYNSGTTTTQVQFTLNQSGVWTWGVTNNNTFFQSGNYTLAFSCSGSAASCTPDGSTLCLNNGRFQVRATYDAGNGNAGNAHVVSLTGDTGYLWFFSSSNVEAVVKVLNGCGLDSHYWVFAGGLTNVRVVLTVTDTKNGTVQTYRNPQGTPFQPIQDTSAFPTCP